MLGGLTRLVLASGNSGKFRELDALLSPLGVGLEPQSRFRIAGAEETGVTFVENALLKARHAAELSGLPALADDSGLIVEALDGEPGVHSARFAGRDASDAQNVALLLERLSGQPAARRKARFHCTLVLLRHAADPAPLICEAQWPGAIAEASAGSNGFGYDPVFLVPGLDCTAAELGSDVKNRISHRGQALALLAERLRGDEW